MQTAQEFTTQFFDRDTGEWQPLHPQFIPGWPHNYDAAKKELVRMQDFYSTESYRIVNGQGVAVATAGVPLNPSSPVYFEPLSAGLSDDTCKDTNPKDSIGSRKPPLSTIPFPVLFEVGSAMLEGAMKYRRHNYRIAGVRSSVYFDATMRHLASWWEGEDIDPDSGLHHVTKAIASLIVLRDAQMNDMIAQDDRPPSAVEGWLEDVQFDVDELISQRPNPLPPYTIEDDSAQFTRAYDRALAEAAAQNEPEFSLTVKLPCTGQHGVVYDMHQTPLDVELRDEAHAIAVAETLAEHDYLGREVTLWRRPCGDACATPFKVFRFDQPAPSEPQGVVCQQEHPDSDESIRLEIALNGGGFDEYGNRVEPIFDEAPTIDPELVERLKKGIPALILAGIIMSALGCSPYQNGGLIGSGD